MSKKEKANFIAVSNLRELVTKYQNFGEKIAFKYKRKGKVVNVTYEKFAGDIKALGTAILNLEIDKIAIIGSNRYAWFASYMAIITAGKVVVPIDKDLTPREIKHIIQKSGAQAVIYDEKYNSILDSCDNLEYKICMDELIKDGVVRYSNLCKQGYDLLKRKYDVYYKVVIEKSQVAVELYTPEEEMLTLDDLCFRLNSLQKYFNLKLNDTILSILPINSDFECMVTFLYGTYCGATIAFNDGQKYIEKNIKEYNVTKIIADTTFIKTLYESLQKIIEQSDKKEEINKKKKGSKLFSKFNLNSTKKIYKEIIKEYSQTLEMVVYEEAELPKEIIDGYNEIGLELIKIKKLEKKETEEEIQEETENEEQESTSYE